MQASLTTGRDLRTMPLDFMGLSYESPQLSNPDFFSATNSGLIKMFRSLSPAGVLRLGGNLGDFTFWDGPGAPALSPEQEAAIVHAKTYFEWILVDPVAREKRRSITTLAAIRNLRGFLDATGWQLLYGINFGSGTPDQAAFEASAVQELIGSRLIAFQIGNECDFFAPSRRPKPWDFAQYWTDYQRFVTAIRTKVPGARFGGPDVAIRTDWVVDYSKAAQHDSVLLSKHHYVMGPAEDPRMNAERLFGPDADLDKQVPALMEASRISGLPCRITEINSCFHGGRPGVSDAYASALWAADSMLQLAQQGFAGVNLHGGGDGVYSPIVGNAQAGFTARPICQGMRFAQQFAGAVFIETKLDTGSARLTAYAANHADARLLAVINKGPSEVSVSLQHSAFAKLKCIEGWTLSAPSLDSTAEVSLKQWPSSELRQAANSNVAVAAYSAKLLRFN